MKLSLINSGKYAPILQGIFVITFAIFLGLVAKIVGLQDEMVYVFIFAPMLLFCITNPAIAGFTNYYNIYLLLSLPTFIISLGINYLIVKLMITITPEISDNMTLMYMLMAVIFFLVHTLGFLFKNIRQYLEGSD